MQNLTPNRTDNQPRVSGQVTPEIAEALRRSTFQLEAEYFPMDWESREELAEELRATLDDLDDAEADVIARVAEDLSDETEDFSSWDTRSDAARRVRLVIRSLEPEPKEVCANA